MLVWGKWCVSGPYQAVLISGMDPTSCVFTDGSLSLLEHLLHPNCIEYLSLFPADASETPAFDKTILFMEIYASGIKGRYIG